ncbi:hypothetical protein ACIRBX_12145 [Kitasatospora sp. NPDC096147]|uniref:hypothetical protein n=1 Tax=Kitasatospora sp. NPDC096147 TaxID=3364093 RepID=UPI003801A9B3
MLNHGHRDTGPHRRVVSVELADPRHRYLVEIDQGEAGSVDVDECRGPGLVEMLDRIARERYDIPAGQPLALEITLPEGCGAYPDRMDGPMLFHTPLPPDDPEPMPLHRRSDYLALGRSDPDSEDGPRC